MPEFLATDGPVVFKYNGKSYTVPQAKMGDYTGWLAELHEKRKAALTKIIPAGLPIPERYKLLRTIELDEPTHWSLTPELEKPDGIERVLKIVLPRAKPKKLDPAEVFSVLAAHEQYRLACYTSGLFPPAQLSIMFGPSIEVLTQQAIQHVSLFQGAMKAAGIDDKLIEMALLKMPGITPEVLRGEAPNTAQEKAATFGKNE